MNILQAIETFGKDALKEIELPVSSIDKVFLVLSKGAADAPEVATVVRTMISMSLTLGADTSGAVSADGLNIAEDVKVLDDAKNLFAYVKTTVIPTVEKTWDDLAATSKTTGLASADPAPAKAAVPAEGQAGFRTVLDIGGRTVAAEPAAGAVSGPGLHVALNQ